MISNGLDGNCYCVVCEKIAVKIAKKGLTACQMFVILGKSSMTRPIGQAVKTPPSHGGNRGSIPLLATAYYF